MPRKGLLKRHGNTISLCVKATDVVLFVLSGLAAYYYLLQSTIIPKSYLVVLVAAAVLVLPVFSFFGIYQSLRGWSHLAHARSLLLAIVSVMLLLMGGLFIVDAKLLVAREWFLFWTLSVIVLLTAFRLLFWQLLRVMRKKGWNQKRVVIIGSGDFALKVVQQIRSALWTGFSLVEVLDDNMQQEQCGVDGVLFKKTPAEIHNYIQQLNVDEVWIVLPLKAEERVKQLLELLRENLITIRYFPDLFAMRLLNFSMTEIFNFPAVNLQASPMQGTSRVLKWLEDRLLSALILILVSPLLILVVTLVKISSPGPILYRQKRVSLNGKEFDMLKFRSMVVDAEARTGAIWAKPDDARTTTIGAWLRKTSLDELPQFINVLRGEMSIVGPRPERPEIITKFKQDIPDYMQKHLVKAGITGWAQVHGWRGNTCLKKRIEYDLYYIENWSIMLDFKIILLTLFKGFMNKNAY